jgi:hypothetical protein
LEQVDQFSTVTMAQFSAVTDKNVQEWRMSALIATYP